MVDRHVALHVLFLIAETSDLHLPLLHTSDDGFLMGSHVHQSCLVVRVVLIVDTMQVGIQIPPRVMGAIGGCGSWSDHTSLGRTTRLTNEDHL